MKRQTQEIRRQFSVKDKLIEIWLWAVAVAFTVAEICTFAALMFGLTICLMRLING